MFGDALLETVSVKNSPKGYKKNIKQFALMQFVNISNNLLINEYLNFHVFKIAVLKI